VAALTDGKDWGTRSALTELGAAAGDKLAERTGQTEGLRFLVAALQAVLCPHDLSELGLHLAQGLGPAQPLAGIQPPGGLIERHHVGVHVRRRLVPVDAGIDHVGAAVALSQPLQSVVEVGIPPLPSQPKLMGCSLRTAQYAVHDLVAEWWVSVVKLNGPGTVSAYVVNDRVAWGERRDKLHLSAFSATVVADQEDQDAALLGHGDLRRRKESRA